MTDRTSAIGVVDVAPDEPVEEPVLGLGEEPVFEFDDDPAGEPFELDVVEEPGVCPESALSPGLLLPPPHPAKSSAEISAQQTGDKNICFTIVSFCYLSARSF